LAYESGRNIWINLYLPSRAEFPALGLTLTQCSEFPAESKILFTVTAPEPSRATLRLRLPGWLSSPAKVVLEGRTRPASDFQIENGYLLLDRVWRDGDSFVLELPMGIRTRQAMDDTGCVSFFHGPVLLAGALGRDGYPESDITFSHTAFHSLPPSPVPPLASVAPEDVHRVPEKPLTYQVQRADGGNIQLIPFYQLHHQRYSLYWRETIQPATPRL
jgi:DUF1680 family protein